MTFRRLGIGKATPERRVGGGRDSIVKEGNYAKGKQKLKTSEEILLHKKEP